MMQRHGSPQPQLRQMLQRPMMRPTRPGGPMMRPTRPGGPMMRPTRPGGPMMRPTRPGGPMMRPTRPGGQMMRPDWVRLGKPSPGFNQDVMRAQAPGGHWFEQTRMQRVMAPVRMPDGSHQTSILPHLLQGGPRHIRPPGMRPMRPVRPAVRLHKVYLCPTCGLKFPCPESNPETQFKTNFSCHVLFNHLRSEVEAEMGSDDLEVCPADDCPYNIVQLREDGVPDAESFLIKHYISKHLDVLLPLINENPTYCHEACLQTIQVTSADLPGKSTSPTKNQGMPNVKLKPIFLDKYFKFARTVAKCAVPADCDPIHVAVFLTQWTSKRSYSIAGIKELVQWVSEVHSLVDNKPLYQHPR